MSYVADLLSPALMILAAAVTFIGASHYLSKTIGAARPIAETLPVHHGDRLVFVGKVEQHVVRSEVRMDQASLAFPAFIELVHIARHVSALLVTIVHIHRDVA